MLTAEEARKLAKRQLGHVAHGKDPAKARQDDRRAPTVKDLAEDYMTRHALPNKRPASVRNDRAMLDNIVLPKLGSLKVTEVSRLCVAVNMGNRKRRWKRRASLYA